MLEDSGNENKWMDLRDIQKKNKIHQEEAMGRDKTEGENKGNAQVSDVGSWVKGRSIN